MAFVVLGVALVLETFSLRTAALAANDQRGDRSWWTFIRTSKTPELPVVLLEDFGALVGLLIAAVTASVLAFAEIARRLRRTTGIKEEANGQLA